MNSLSSPFAGLMQPDVNEDADTPKSLFDLINSHNSQNCNDKDEDVSSLSDLTSKLLKVDKSSATGETTCHLPSCLGDLMLVGNDANRGTKDCNSLEAYTKSFLNSKGSNVLQFRKTAHCFNSKGHTLKTQSKDTDIKQISEKLQNICVDDSGKTETRKIDLTVALQSRATDSTIPTTEVATKQKRSVFLYPVQECTIDLSSLADENLLNSNTSLSSFGYVISKEWSRIILPKKYRKLERTRPYNIAKSFKFDTPSPDECVLKNRVRNTSVSDA